jgi:hypothetical protein
MVKRLTKCVGQNFNIHSSIYCSVALIQSHYEKKKKIEEHMARLIYYKHWVNFCFHTSSLLLKFIMIKVNFTVVLASSLVDYG